MQAEHLRSAAAEWLNTSTVGGSVGALTLTPGELSGKEVVGWTETR
jgi:hypothetical protein